MMGSAFDSFDGSPLGARIQSAVDGSGAFGVSGGADGPIYFTGYSWDPDGGGEPAALPAAPTNVTFIGLTNGYRNFGGSMHVMGNYNSGSGNIGRVYRHDGASWTQVGGDITTATAISFTAYNGTMWALSNFRLWSLIGSTWTEEYVTSGTHGNRVVGPGGQFFITGYTTGAGASYWDGSALNASAAAPVTWIESDGLLYTLEPNGTTQMRLKSSSDNFETSSIVATISTNDLGTAFQLHETARFVSVNGTFYLWYAPDAGKSRLQLATVSGGSVTYHTTSSKFANAGSAAWPMLAHNGRVYTCGGTIRNQVHTGSIDSVSSPPSSTTYRVTVNGSTQDYNGDTDVPTTAANIVASLNALGSAPWNAITWTNPSGGTIVATVDEQGVDYTCSLAVVSGSGTATTFSITTTSKRFGIYRWDAGAGDWQRDAVFGSIGADMTK